MIKLTINKQKNRATINLFGEIAINDVRELKTVMKKALKKTDTVKIKLQKLKGLHISVLQLLLSTKKTALTQNKKIEIASSDSEVFKNILQSAGLSHVSKLFL